MKKHFVTFFSPGTLIAETTEKPIDAWDIDKAVILSRSVTERYGAKPYGFRFSTRERSNDDLDSKVTKNSPMYYLGGKSLSLDELKAENNPDNEILIQNIECNGWRRVIRNNNSWEWTQPLNDDDVILTERQLKKIT